MSTKYKKYLDPMGIEALKPMQIKAIDTILNKKETVLLSPTGSGKTLAFLLPLLSLINKTVQEVQVMIILPTRELTIQVETVFKQLQSGYKVNACYGGHSMTVEKNNFKNPPKVLIGTPGRILDHINRHNFDLKAINTLIIDEFDKCLELGFKEEMKKIIRTIRPTKTILTSATDLLDIPPFTKVEDPIILNYLDHNAQKQNNNLTIRAIHSEDRDKLESLGKLLKEVADEPTIVFCNRKDAIDRVADYLFDQGLEAVCFHGNLDQDERERAIVKFKNHSANILLCTDLASRGLDIDNIKNIVHYHLPHQEDVFTHRNGRTARMQNKGNAFLIFAPEEILTFDSSLNFEEYDFTFETKYKDPEYDTFYVSKGKKDKINKMDIVGFFYKQMGLEKDELGIIVVKDFCAYVGVKNSARETIFKQAEKQKIKGKSVKIELAR